MSTRCTLLAALALFLAGCDAAPCVRLSDCPSNLTCSAGACVVPPMDGSTEEDAAVPTDTGSTDTGSTDTGSTDTSGTDTGPRDAAATDAARASDAGSDAP